MTLTIEYNLHCKFDLLQHKEKYPHYLEVIITKEGDVIYAVPSHQEKLIQMMMFKNNMTRQEVQNSIPQEYWFDIVEYMCKELECISVWTNYFVGDTNRKQRNTLRKLKLHGVYEGMLRFEDTERED